MTSQNLTQLTFESVTLQYVTELLVYESTKPYYIKTINLTESMSGVGYKFDQMGSKWDKYGRF